MTTMALSSFDTQIQCDERIPCCPYCDESLDIGGPIQDGMHAECNRKFGEELDDAFPDQYPVLPIPAHLEPIEFDWLEDLDALDGCVWPDRD